MSEFLRVASIADYKPNFPPRGEVPTSPSSFLVRFQDASDGFSINMVLGAHIRTSPKVALAPVCAVQTHTSSANFGAVLQLFSLQRLRQHFVLTTSGIGSIAPSRAGRAATRAIIRI